MNAQREAAHTPIGTLLSSDKHRNRLDLEDILCECEYLELVNSQRQKEGGSQRPETAGGRELPQDCGVAVRVVSLPWLA